MLLDVSGAHSYPFSMVHVLLQPSPFTLFLSSQISGLFITPFPHFKVHFEILLLDVSGAHSYPFSMVHVLLQPSPFTLFLSSQISGLFGFHYWNTVVGCVWSTLYPFSIRMCCYNRSIYIIRFTLKYFVGSGAQSYPFSMVHVLLQPSPFTLFLSSQIWTIYHSVSTF